MDADLQFFRGMAGAQTGFAITIDQRAEAAMLTADDRDHQGQPKIPGANEGGGRASDAEPDGQRVLQRARVNALPGERRTVPARPMDVGLLADLQEQVEALGKERIVIIELEAEERERLDERAAPGDDLGPSLREQ